MKILVKEKFDYVLKNPTKKELLTLIELINDENEKKATKEASSNLFTQNLSYIYNLEDKRLYMWNGNLYIHSIIAEKLEVKDYLQGKIVINREGILNKLKLPVTYYKENLGNLFYKIDKIIKVDKVLY